MSNNRPIYGVAAHPEFWHKLFNIEDRAMHPSRRIYDYRMDKDVCEIYWEWKNWKIRVDEQNKYDESKGYTRRIKDPR